MLEKDDFITTWIAGSIEPGPNNCPDGFIATHHRRRISVRQTPIRATTANIGLSSQCQKSGNTYNHVLYYTVQHVELDLLCSSTRCLYCSFLQCTASASTTPTAHYKSTDSIDSSTEQNILGQLRENTTAAFARETYPRTDRTLTVIPC